MEMAGNEVYGFVAKKTALLRDKSPWSRAMLARLRRGVGKTPGGVPEIWEITLGGLPERLQSHCGAPTFAEQAVHTALTLYAVHQQGQDQPMSVSDDGERRGHSLGAAAGQLVRPDESNLSSIKRRFDAIATAADFAELAYHARGLVQLLKAEGIPLDYPRFAKDLTEYQCPEGADRVRLRWGQDFYRALYRGAEQKNKGE
jgi:CRISPR system Cascade subunit CasB